MYLKKGEKTNSTDLVSDTICVLLVEAATREGTVHHPKYAQDHTATLAAVSHGNTWQ